MNSKIKQITLIDGKQLFYPNEEEVRRLSTSIKEFVIEEIMTAEEYYYKYLMLGLAEGISITHIELKDYYSQNGDG